MKSSRAKFYIVEAQNLNNWRFRTCPHEETLKSAIYEYDQFLIDGYDDVKIFAAYEIKRSKKKKRVKK